MKNTINFSDSCNNDLFFELNDYEASISYGGISFTNASKKPITFVGLDEKLLNPKPYSLASKGNVNVTEPYIVYDSDIQPKVFIPTLSDQLDDSEEYTFTVNKNAVNLTSEPI